MKNLCSLILLCSLFFVGCRKSPSIYTIVEREQIGAGEVGWNAQHLENLDVIGHYVRTDNRFVNLQATRYTGDFEEADVGFSITKLLLDSQGDTIHLKETLPDSQDSARISMRISEGDVTLVHYTLRNDRPAWVVIESWDPVAEEIAVSFAATFRRRFQDRPSLHPLGEDDVRITNGHLRGPIFNPDDN